MLHVDISSGDMNWALVSMRSRVTMHEGECCVQPLRARSCVSLCRRGRMQSVMARSYATFGDKVVCDLGIQVAHEGSSYVECARRVAIDWTRHDVKYEAGHLVNF